MLSRHWCFTFVSCSFAVQMSRTRSSTPVLDVGPSDAVCGDLSEPDSPSYCPNSPEPEEPSTPTKNRGCKRPAVDGVDSSDDETPPNIKEAHKSAKTNGSSTDDEFCRVCSGHGQQLRDKLGYKCPGCMDSVGPNLLYAHRYLVHHTAVLLSTLQSFEEENDRLNSDIIRLKQSKDEYSQWYEEERKDRKKAYNLLSIESDNNARLRDHNDDIKNELERLLKKLNIDN